MNQNQKKYAIERVNAILERRLKDAKVRHTTPAVRLTAEERLAHLKAKKFKVRGDVRKVASYLQVYDFLEFPAEKDEKVNESALKKEQERLHADAMSICDELMLGDAEQALELIRGFDKV